MIQLLQGVYYLITGLWPVAHINSFEKITGAKTDDWLVKTMGIILADIGLLVLVLPASAAKPLGISIAASLMAVDIFYSSKGTISKIYLADALIQAVLIILWLVSQ